MILEKSLVLSFFPLKHVITRLGNYMIKGNRPAAARATVQQWTIIYGAFLCNDIQRLSEFKVNLVITIGERGKTFDTQSLALERQISPFL